MTKREKELKIALDDLLFDASGICNVIPSGLHESRYYIFLKRSMKRASDLLDQITRGCKPRGKTVIAGSSYEDGFRNGRADAFLGIRLTVALTSPDMDYSTGYFDGNSGAAHRPDGMKS